MRCECDCENCRIAMKYFNIDDHDNHRCYEDKHLKRKKMEKKDRKKEYTLDICKCGHHRLVHYAGKCNHVGEVCNCSQYKNFDE